MKTHTTVKPLIVITLIALLGLGAYAFADGGYPVSGQTGRAWHDGAAGPATGYGTYRGNRAPAGRGMPAYGNPNGPVYRDRTPMMNTTHPGDVGNRMNRGRIMNPHGGGRNCNW